MLIKNFVKNIVWIVLCLLSNRAYSTAIFPNVNNSLHDPVYVQIIPRDEEKMYEYSTIFVSAPLIKPGTSMRIPTIDGASLYTISIRLKFAGGQEKIVNVESGALKDGQDIIVKSLSGGEIYLEGLSPVIPEEQALKIAVRLPVVNECRFPIRITIVPYFPPRGQMLPKALENQGNIQPFSTGAIGTLPGYLLYDVHVYDISGRELIVRAIPGPISSIKKLKISGEKEKINIQVGYINQDVAAEGQKVLKEVYALAAQQVAMSKVDIYERCRQEHPKWMVEVEKLGPNYKTAFIDFCYIRSMTKDPEKAYDTLVRSLGDEFFQMSIGGDAQIALLLALGTTAVYDTQPYKDIIEGITFADFRSLSQIVIFPAKNRKLLGEKENDPRLYKIHLMPLDENLVIFYGRLIKFIMADPQLREYVYCFKVLSLSSVSLSNMNAPRLVLYIYSDKEGDAGIQDSKEKTQIVLDKLYAAFKDIPGSKKNLEFNEKVTDLIYVAQGNRQDKMGGITQKDIFDENLVYFKPGYQGSKVDFRLRNPAKLQAPK